MRQLAAFIVAAVVLLRSRGANGQENRCDNNDFTFDGTCSAIPDGIGCGRFYTHTYHPNIVTASEVEAVQFFTSYQIFYDNPTDICTPLAEVYTCVALFPVCDGAAVAPVRPPCRSLCAQVLADCNSWITERGGSSLDIKCLVQDCDRFPATDCIGMDDPIIQKVLAEATVPTVITSGPTNMPTQPTGNGTDMISSQTGNDTGTCPPQKLNFFKSEEENFAKGWIAFWSILCFLSTLVTILTFCLDPSRFEYPWRPVIYLALSFNIHALGYFFALILGRDLVTCPDDEYVESDISWHWGHTPCILVFSLLYYSIMAAFLWWLVLTFSWFLASAFKWSNEAVGNLSPFFHVVAWVTPLLLTISLIAARVVSADELTATCFVVRDDRTATFVGLLVGLILPLCAILITGVVFLCIGFISAFRIHSFMKHERKQQESRVLEKLMIRVGIFVAVYIVPATIIISCFIYEVDTRPDWTPVDTTCSNCTRPNTAIFMVRIFMFLLIGALTGVWIWSKKTIDSWQALPTKLRECWQVLQCCEVSLELQQGERDDVPPPRAYSLERKSNQFTESADSSA